MRLVIDGRRLTANRTGVGRYLETLLDEWAITELPAEETVVVLADPEGMKRVPSAPGLTARVLSPQHPGILWERWALGRFLRDDDVLFAPTNLLPPSWDGPSVLVMHDALQELRPDDFPWHVRWRFGRRYRSAARRASRILVHTHAVGRDVSRIYGIDPAKIRVVHPAVASTFRRLQSDVSEFQALRKVIPNCEKMGFFLFVGKRSKRRHSLEILRAFQSHRHVFPNHLLIFVGPRKESAEDLSRGIIDAGHVDEPTVVALLNSAIGLLYPSEYEGFGYPVIEAMACGCPVVTLRRDPLVEAGGDAAIYLEHATVESLRDTMRRLAVDGEFRQTHVALGLERAKQFEPAKFASVVRDELRAFLGKRSD